jgi:hypothetical protein
MLIHCIKASRNRIVGFCGDDEYDYYVVYKTASTAKNEFVDTEDTIHELVGRFPTASGESFIEAIFPELAGHPRLAKRHYFDQAVIELAKAAILVNGSKIDGEVRLPSNPFVRKGGPFDRRLDFKTLKDTAILYHRDRAHGWIVDKVFDCQTKYQAVVLEAFKNGANDSELEDLAKEKTE